MRKAVKIIMMVVAMLVCVIMLFPVGEVVADGATTYYGSIFLIYRVKVVDPISNEAIPARVTFELFGKEIYSREISNNISNTDVNLGNSDVLAEESLQSAANIILDEIGSWHSVKRVYDVTYCGDEKSADSLDYCIELGEKNYTECAVFKSNFLTANSVQSGGWNPNDVYTDWQWYLAKTENGEWELLTWGY